MLFSRFLLAISYLAYLPLIPLLPLILAQGKHLRKTALRLPEAQGERHGGQLENPTVSLLHLGESTVAGVGVAHSSQGFSAQIGTELAALNICNHWAYIAQTGLTSQELLDYLNTQNIPRCSHLLITLGVNDTTAFYRLKRWRNNLCQLVALVRRLSPNCQVAFTQVPPMQRFPALSTPLNLFLGLRAWQVNQALQQLCQQQNWTLLQIAIPLTSNLMAEDGYHPNQQGYQLWAKGVCALWFKPPELS